MGALSVIRIAPDWCTLVWPQPCPNSTWDMVAMRVNDDKKGGLPVVYTDGDGVITDEGHSRVKYAPSAVSTDFEHGTLRIEGEGWAAQLRKQTNEGQPYGMRVEVRGALCSVGRVSAIDQTAAAMTRAIFPDHADHPDYQPLVQRLDLAADVWHRDAADLDTFFRDLHIPELRRDWTTHARHTGADESSSDGRATKKGEAIHIERDHTNARTVDIGRGVGLSLCCYEKHKDFKGSTKSLVVDEWAGAGWDDSGGVLRVEFRALRDWLRKTAPNGVSYAKRGTPTLAERSWWHLRAILPTLMDTFLSRIRHTPGQSHRKHVDRRDSPIWTAVREARRRLVGADEQINIGHLARFNRARRVANAQARVIRGTVFLGHALDLCDDAVWAGIQEQMRRPEIRAEIDAYEKRILPLQTVGSARHPQEPDALAQWEAMAARLRDQHCGPR